MDIKDLLEETFLAITVNKMRSGLTVLGIVIGIASVIAMVSIGQGAKGTIEANIQSIGSNLILITPGFQRNFSSVSSGRGAATTLTQEDSDAIENNVSSIQASAPEISRRYQITAKSKNTNTQVTGTVASYPEVRNLQMESGSFITNQNVSSYSKVAVLGPTVRDDLFGSNSNPIGKTIRINKIDFKVIGISKSKGGTGMGNQDDVVYVPVSTAQRFLANSEYLTTISVKTVDQESMATVQAEITTLLLKQHNISNPQLADFQVMNQEDIIATASSVTNTFTVLLASIASISLIVGGIGIMNMMLTTVTERTREIGLRKAIGADKKDIAVQFLSESFVLTFFGGAIGILLGWLISIGITRFASITTEVSLVSIFLAFGVSTTIGIIFGYYPARRASNLNPIEALRFE